MKGLPYFTQRANFSATGYANVCTADIPLPLQRIPTKWSIQVTGVAADGKTNVAASSWTVSLQGSLDGIGYDGDSAAAIVAHTNGTNADGSVVKSGGNFSPVRFVRIHCSALSLGSAASILVSVVGEP